MTDKTSRQGDYEIVDHTYDVVVVGSGYGGGVAASRLSRAGQRVCVIERGREVPTGAFPALPPAPRRELQVNGGQMRAGFLDGRPGFLLAALSGHSTFVKYADLWLRGHDPGPPGQETP